MLLAVNVGLVVDHAHQVPVGTIQSILVQCFEIAYWQVAKPTKPSNVGKNAVNMGFSVLVMKQIKSKFKLTFHN